MPRLSKNQKRRLEQRVSERFFNGLPVVDAENDVRIFVNERDIKKAQPNDPLNCVYAQACKRLFGSQTIVFLRTKAYIDLPDEQGNRQVNRFEIPMIVREQIIHFDKTGEAAPGGFLLQAPTPSQKLNAMAEYSREKRKRQGKDHETPEDRKRASIRGARTMVASIEVGVRDGRGLVHFERENAEAA